jgi:hypothetical protein
MGHYPKEGGSDYAVVNPHNLKPIFTSKHLSTSICAIYLIHPIMCSVIVMDVEQLHNNILRAISEDPVTKAHLDNSDDVSQPRWSRDPHGFLRLDGCIYVPDVGTL